MQEIYIKLERIFNNNEHPLLCSTCEKLLEKYPADIEILTYLSRSLLTLSKLEQSKEICERIIKLNKNIPEPYLNIARIYSNQKKFEQAINFYKKTLEIDASYFVYFELGVLYFNINDYSNSGYFISKAVKKKIDLAEGYFYLGLIYQKANKIYLAIESFTEAIKYKSDYASAYNNLGTLYLDLNKADEAIYYFNQAIKFNSKLYIAHSNLAQGYLVKGDFDKVKSVLIKSLDIKPDDGESHRLLSVIYKYKSKEDSHFRQMYEHVSKVNLDKNSKMHFNFALAKASEDMKDYKSSANFLKIGNSIRRTNFNYNINYDIEQFSLIKKNFTKEIFEKHKDKGCLTNKSIFIVGMPRSGTTLIEQIISSHPDVYGAGELEFLANVINEYFKDPDPNIFFNKFNKADSSIFKQIGESYLNLVLKLNDKKFITDKMPVNFRLVGFIKLALPNAKIIHCCRSAQDTCLSIYKNYFGKNVMPWAYDEIELSTYYNEYKNLMNYWHQVLPNTIYDLHYEKLIKDQVNETKKLIEYCGLTWNDSCISFDKNTRSVGTASVNQVRQKIYQSSFKLWENYKESLPRLFENLS